MKKIELTFLILLFVIGLMAGSVQAGGTGERHGFRRARARVFMEVQGRRVLWRSRARVFTGVQGRGYYGGWWPGIFWGGLALAGLPWYPYNYYPQPSTVVQQPQVYVQPQQQDDYYWYYCENPKGYYPYVSRCPSGWMKVVPNANPQTAPPN